MEYNLRLDPLCGESRQIVRSKSDESYIKQMQIVGHDPTALADTNLDQKSVLLLESILIEHV